ncbi:DMT family transporter [Bradyrhizobium sp. LHD-71]|uniref:DMT family transporter n=1 Tax=Bradyrhizobium sp. LHD-71 TaxID=3072141 RepID=UPI00280C517D|nr:DMT family transporter [Bradyrhizobium sp. LHD-71]MDQ8729956.1 DMT family transporter [Bradyrhizobium sp. LHD-71]
MNNKISASGLAFLLVTSIGWGVNWPIMKYVLAQWPPLSARGWTGVAGAVALALYAFARGISLRVPRDQWLWLVISAVLNVSLWMAVMGYALVFVTASEGAVIAYTMPVWTALLAWPLLGERLTWTRVIALAMAFAGLVSLLGGNEMSAGIAKLPGVLLALGGAIGFALGTILLKKRPLRLPGATAAAWQIGIGCAPVALAGLIFERPEASTLTSGGWAALAYMTFGQFCIAYVCWFAALERLPVSIAAIGTTLVPVIGVLVSAVALHEPLGPAQIAALLLTVGGVALAARS